MISMCIYVYVHILNDDTHSYQARPFGSSITDIRGGRRALIRALEKSLEHLQATRIDLYQVSKSHHLRCPCLALIPHSSINVHVYM